MKEQKHYLETIIWGPLPITNYRGTLVTKLPSGRYSIWGHAEITAEEVDEYIDSSLKVLDKSIKG